MRTQPRPQEPDPATLLDASDLEAITGIPRRTFDNYVWRGTGPAYIKIGRHRRYRRADVEAWIDANRHVADGTA